jgi:hypothetical protein
MDQILTSLFVVVVSQPHTLKSDYPFELYRSLYLEYHVFGRWDFAVFFEADTNMNALHFAGDIVRPIEGVVAMRTIPLAPLRIWG